MSNCLVFEDGILIENSINDNYAYMINFLHSFFNTI